MLTRPLQQKVLKKINQELNRKLSTKSLFTNADLDWLRRWKTLNEDEQLELITLCERVQCESIIRGMVARDKEIVLPKIGVFHWRDDYFVWNDPDKSHWTKEEKLNYIIENFRVDPRDIKREVEEDYGEEKGFRRVNTKRKNHIF